MLKNNKINYYKFAEDDYYGIKKNIQYEIYFTGLPALCQNTCERFLKHIIDIYIPENEDNKDDRNFAMHTHSLRNLCDFINNNLNDFEIDKRKIYQVDGFYFTSRYPMRDNGLADKEDSLIAWDVTKYCKKVVDDYIESH